MAKQPTPAFRVYEQTSAPQAREAPQARAQDVSSGLTGIAQSLTRAGAAVQNYQETDLAIERIQQQRREEDARTDVARRMAQVRSEATTLRQTVLDGSPDGWRDATTTYAQRFGELQSTHLSDTSLTPEARILLEDQLHILQYDQLDRMTEQERGARDAWQTDTWRSSIDTNSGSIVADPSQYEAARLDTLEQLAGITDANQRRDLTEYAEQSYAMAAVGAMVEDDPRATLRALENPEADTPFSRLTGQQRIGYIHQAQAEINRQRSEAAAARAQSVAMLRDTVNAQNQLLQRGIMPSQPLDVGAIASVLGPDVAQNYVANLTGASAAQGMADMPLAVVAQIAAGAPSPENGDIGNLMTVEARTAAQTMLRERTADPGSYALSRNLLPHPDLLPTISQAIQSGDWQAAGVALRQRSVAAVDLRNRGVVSRVAPLSTPEAQALAQGLSGLPTQARIQFYASLSQNMDREAYTALMGQISNDAPVTAFAGFLWNNPAGRAQNSRAAAERILRGAELLNGGPPGENGRRSPLIAMPPEAELRSAWRTAVGNAYEHLRGTARPGEPDPEEQAFQVFRADYAALSEGAASDNYDSNIARRAAALATGGVTEWGPSDRRTLMPWGMTRPQFEAGVRAGFERIGRRGADIHDYELRAMGGGRYQVFVGNQPARNTTGGNLFITVARPNE